MEILLTSLFNTPTHKQVQARGGRVYSAMVKPFPGRTEPNVLLFAATRTLVFGHKAGTGDTRFSSYKPVSDEQYRQAFLEMLDSRCLAIDAWIEEQQGHDAVLCCSCKDRTKFCHLDVLAVWLQQTCPQITITRV